MIKMTDHMVARPLNDYDPAWGEWNEQNPGVRRSVGAEAAEDGEPGEPAPDAPADAPAEAPQEAPANDDWRNAIADPGARKHADSYTSPADMAEKSFQMRQKLSNAVNIPGKDASDEDRQAFNEKMGVPKTAADYTFTAPEGAELTEDDQTHIDNLKTQLHKAGLSQTQFDQLTSDIMVDAKAQKEANAKKIEGEMSEAQEKLQAEWGDDFTVNTNHANRALKAFGGDEFARILEEEVSGGVKMGNHPALMRVFASIGRKISESTLDLTMTPQGKADAEERMEELTVQMHAAYAAKDTPKAERLMKDRSELSEKTYGDAEQIR